MQISIANIIRGTLIGNTMSVLTRYISRVVNGGGIVEAPQCVETALNSQPLLGQASLVLIPSGYKEDVVYSEIPTSGAGDLSFTRASNGTRINSAGLVEDVPWNLLQSETFDNASWAKNTGGTSTVNVTANNGTAPNGTNTADRIQLTRDSTGYAQVLQTITTTASQSYTFSVYLKSLSGTPTVMFGSYGGTNAQTATLTNEWVRYTWTATSPTSAFGMLMIWGGVASTSLSADFLAWGYQLVEGATAKPYFPTTDRLNVPRLTYQNGGGGCPSLLLEKQSTNLVSYSQDFTNAYWSKTNQGVGSNAVITPNYTTSPDGTNNAFRLQCNLNGGTTSNDRSWMIASFTAPATSTLSIWIKLNSAGTKTFVFSNAGGGTKTISGTDWQRIDGTFVGATGQFRIGLIGGSTSDTLDCSIWGAQAESGSYPTSYIPTTSSSATRVADACSKTGISSLIGQTEGTLFANVYITNNDGDQRVSISDGTSSNRIAIRIDGTLVQLSVVIGAVVQASIGGNIISVGNVYKIAAAYKENDFVLYVNGVQIGTDTSGTISGTLSRFAADRGDGSQSFYNPISQALLFKTRLSDTDCEVMTGTGYDSYSTMATALGYTII
jgi:hypothetical protein